MSTMAMPQLSNRRWEIFATELASGAPLLTSYLTAGYKNSYSARYNASRLRNTPAVRNHVNELLTEFSRTTFVRLEWIQHQLVNIVEGRAESCIRVGDDGKRYVETDRMAALTALAKTIGGFVSRAEVSGPGGAPIQTEELAAMRPAELAARLSVIIEQAANEAATAESEPAAVPTTPL